VVPVSLQKHLPVAPAPSIARPVTPECVETTDDPRVADYRGIRDGALLRERGLFVVEGRTNVRRLVLESAYAPQSLFLSFPAARAMGDVFSALPVGAAVFVARRAVLSEIAGFDIHRGCLALCRRPAPVAPSALFAPPGAPSVLVVLDSLTNPDNVGVVFRNALAFGAGAVLLSPQCCDPLYRKAVRVSMGAALVVPTARFEKWPEGLEAVRGAGYRLVALAPAADARPLDAAHPFPERVALLFGSEGHGASNAVLARADERVRIDMGPGFDAVNVATASGIALH